MTESLGEEVTRLRAENKLLVDDNVCLAAKVKQLTASNDNLRAALFSNMEAWRGLVNSGDCGNWNPETDDNIMTGVQALSKTPAESLDAIKAETIHDLMDWGLEKVQSDGWSHIEAFNIDMLEEYADTLSPVTGE